MNFSENKFIKQKSYTQYPILFDSLIYFLIIFKKNTKINLAFYNVMVITISKFSIFHYKLSTT
jgi:hypothetical protein